MWSPSISINYLIGLDRDRLRSGHYVTCPSRVASVFYDLFHFQPAAVFSSRRTSLARRTWPNHPRRSRASWVEWELCQNLVCHRSECDLFVWCPHCTYLRLRDTSSTLRFLCHMPAFWSTLCLTVIRYTFDFTSLLQPRRIHAIVDVLKQSFVAANIRVTGKWEFLANLFKI